MPKYQLDEAHFLDGKWFPPGAVVEWTGSPSRHMTPMDDDARSAKDAYDGTRPHGRPSRDLPPRAAMLHDPQQRRPGTPRIAGPPNQLAVPTAEAATPIRLIETAEEQKKFQDMEARTADERRTAVEAAAKPPEEKPEAPKVRRGAAARRKATAKKAGEA